MSAQALHEAIKARKAAVEKALAGIAELEAHLESVQANTVCQPKNCKLKPR